MKAAGEWSFCISEGCAEGSVRLVCERPVEAGFQHAGRQGRRCNQLTSIFGLHGVGVGGLEWPGPRFPCHGG